MSKKITVLFLCTGNSCRSQMAEGWARALKAGEIEAYSAGVERHGMNEHAVAVMNEAGVNLLAQGQHSKLVEELPAVAFDYVITLCGHANENCPYFPGSAKRRHVGFDDPPALAKDAKTQDEVRDAYRRVRDEIRSFVEAMPANLA
ncbi:MAG: arsenate reductase ArsC [Proteobacteria bacterium]|nr:arsenate reductase ArsC [Pseudomonadota bacterium]MBU1611812.1 arsenate reductase ArsC [Pseudomonadota bacterium]